MRCRVGSDDPLPLEEGIDNREPGQCLGFAVGAAQPRRWVALERAGVDQRGAAYRYRACLRVWLGWARTPAKASATFGSQRCDHQHVAGLAGVAADDVATIGRP